MIWFTSDQHFSHTNVIKYCNRPYKDKEEMNEALIANHNSVVASEDQVYHLGDFSLWKGAAAAFLHRLNGQHTLVPGNHDFCHPAQAKNKLEKMEALYKDAGFREIFLEGYALIAGEEVKLSHFPYLGLEGGGYEARYPEYRPKNDGSWLLHGHVHQEWKVKDRCINVGVDVWDYKPVALSQVADIILSKTKLVQPDGV